MNTALNIISFLASFEAGVQVALYTAKVAKTYVKDEKEMEKARRAEKILTWAVLVLKILNIFV